MLRNLTIIIPTYNRSKFIIRSFNFWKNSGVNFLIFDSSDLINTELNRYKNYNYIKENNFYKKLFDAVNSVQTKYVMIIADDDFASIDTIEECLKFLDNNNSFVSAQGSYIDFWYDQNNDIDICVRTPSISGTNSNLIQDDPNTRVYNSINKYFHHIYSIHRKEILQQALSISKDLNNNSASEINITLFGSIFGKHKMIENLYICRQIMPISNIIFPDRESFAEWINNKNNFEEVQNWINKLSIFYSQINNLSIEKSKQSISKAIFSYNKQKIGITQLIKSFIKLFIPMKILNIFRHPLYYKKSWPPTQQEASKIRNLSMSDKYYPWTNSIANKQWLDIKKFLNKFGKVEEKSYKI
ncbi:TIGR00180 family glycosyltransferase [Alphaproteobacteria bacterium]|nr:TIGR00180 family glycosyltransferase [Alphaproteobacteria bacterium]